MGSILIADDSPIDRKILRQVLEKRIQDVEIYEASNGIEVMESLAAYSIHVCILDINMPYKNGFEVLKEMKEDPQWMDIPVIVCTATEEKNTIEKALMLGAYDYFSKPLSEEAMKISMPLKVRNAMVLMKWKEEIIYLSYHDKLTGLYNRRFCEKEIERLDTERNLPLSLVLGDVNGLKVTNDAFGHEAGDKLLIRIARILKNECRKDDIVSRFGGDEFLIVMPNTEPEEAQKRIAKIKEQCLVETGDPIKLSISMGLATKNMIDEDIMDIYKMAEDRMYQAKMVESGDIKREILIAMKKVINEQAYQTADECRRLSEIVKKLEINQSH